MKYPTQTLPLESSLKTNLLTRKPICSSSSSISATSTLTQSTITSIPPKRLNPCPSTAFTSGRTLKQEKLRFFNPGNSKKPTVKPATTAPSTSSTLSTTLTTNLSGPMDLMDENTRPFDRSTKPIPTTQRRQSLSQQQQEQSQSQQQQPDQSFEEEEESQHQQHFPESLQQSPQPISFAGQLHMLLKKSSEATTLSSANSITLQHCDSQLATPTVKSRLLRHPFSDVLNFQNSKTISRSSKNLSSSSMIPCEEEYNPDPFDISVRLFANRPQIDLGRRDPTFACCFDESSQVFPSDFLGKKDIFKLQQKQPQPQQQPQLLQQQQQQQQPNYFQGYEEYHKRDTVFSIRVFKEDYLNIPTQFAAVINHNQDDDVSSDEEIVKGGVKYNFKSIIKEVYSEDKISSAPILEELSFQ